MGAGAGAADQSAGGLGRAGWVARCRGPAKGEEASLRPAARFERGGVREG